MKIYNGYKKCNIYAHIQLRRYYHLKDLNRSFTKNSNVKNIKLNIVSNVQKVFFTVHKRFL